jgi:hypothetical protein
MHEHRWRRWFQLSLKSLFFVTLVVAAFFGGLTTERRLAEQAMQEAQAAITQKCAVRQIESLGGNICFDGRYRLYESRHARYPADDESATSARVTGVSFRGTRMNDDGFRLFQHVAKKAGLHQIERLSIAGTQVADAGRLSEMVQLYWLDIGGTQIRDVSPLRSLTHLRVLYMDGLNVPEESIAELRRALPGCTIYHATEYDGPSSASGIELP